MEILGQPARLSFPFCKAHDICKSNRHRGWAPPPPPVQTEVGGGGRGQRKPLCLAPRCVFVAVAVA